jgi:catechol 2,3-dioxygenase-like lactoylglutathione lyase family enzyme
VTPLDSITVTAVDFAAALAFYDAALGALGLVRVTELVDEEEDDAEVEAVAWGSAHGTDGSGVVWLVSGSADTTGLHVRFRADSRAQVETFHETGVANGGATFASPRRWVLYRRGEFNAIVADPAGNLIEAVAAE